MLIYSKVLIANRNDISNFRPPYCDSDGQMVREFAPQTVITGSIPLDMLLFFKFSILLITYL